MVVLVPFLLITAVFSRLTIVELNLPSAAGGATNRITSYNVCYTKLLRDCRAVADLHALFPDDYLDAEIVGLVGRAACRTRQIVV